MSRNNRMPGKISGIIRKSTEYSRRKFSHFPFYLGNGSHALKPVYIKLYINNVCNASCIMCDVGTRNRNSVFSKQAGGNGKHVMTPETCARLVDEIKIFKPKIDIHGLEPLLHNDLGTLLSIIKNAGLNIHLVTNGILLKEKAAELISNHVDRITVSLDGTADIHDRIRGEGVFNRVMEGLETLKHIRPRQKGENSVIMSHFTINRFNFHNLLEYSKRMIGENIVDQIRFSHPYFVSEESSALHSRDYPGFGESSPVNIKHSDPEEVDVKTLWEQMSLIMSSYNRKKVRFNIVFKDFETMEAYYKKGTEPVTGYRCRTPWTRTTIVANGDVLISNRCFSYSPGNIHNENFNNIWNGREYRHFRIQLKKKGYFPPCVRCCGLVPPNGKI